MAEDKRLSTAEASKPNSTPNGPDRLANSSKPTQSRNLKTAKEFISSVAARIADQPLQCFAPEVWGVLTAISEKARQRCQGLNMPLTRDEHCIGRLVDDTHFRITAPAMESDFLEIWRKQNLYVFAWFSQKASMSELKTLLDEERDQRRREREKATADLKLSIQRIRAETAEEIKRVSDGALMREKEQLERINKLQDAEKERCSLVETLRSKLEDTRQKLVDSDNKVRQLEGQIHEELLASARSRKRVEEIEHDRKRLIKELDREKAAREEAWAKVSALELEISVALRDLDFERRGLKGARERIMLRETQLRSFDSTTEEISVLFIKQQEQLKARRRTLEDEENYKTTSVGADLNPGYIHVHRSLAQDKETYEHKIVAKVGLGACHGHGRDELESSSDEASTTEKHDCNVKSRGGGQDTEEVEITSDEHNVGGGLGSDINGNGRTPVLVGDAIGTEQFPETEAVGTAPILEGDVAETEQFVETESQSLHRKLKSDLNKFSTSDDDEMLIDDETNSEALDQAQNRRPDP